MSEFNISPDEVAKLEEKFEIKSNERKLKNLLNEIEKNINHDDNYEANLEIRKF